MKIKVDTLEKAQLLFPELRPEDKGDYFLMYCPECGHKEAFLYKTGSSITCNRRDKCGYRISVFDYLKNNNRLKNSDIFIQSTQIISYIAESKPEKKLILPNSIKFLRDNSGIICDKFKRYLLKRKVNKNFIDELGYVYGSGDKFDNSIFIPFYENGNLVYYICRKTSGDIRYLNSDVSATDKVFNLDNIKEGENVFIFEGVFDAMSINETQISTAMLTNNFSKQKMEKIINKLPKNVIFVPDIDYAGVSSLEKNMRIFSMLVPPSVEMDIYIYLIDTEKFSRLYQIYKSNKPQKEKMKMASLVKVENKDFNDFVKNGNSNIIKLEDCIKWTPNVMDDLALSLWL